MNPQEELNFQWVIGRIRAWNNLRPPSPKASRIQGPGIEAFVAESPVQSVSYALPRSAMMESLVADANARLSLDRGSFVERKLSKGLLAPTMQRHRRYYKEQDVLDVSPTLNDSMGDLLKSSLDKASKKEVSFSAAEAKELEACASSISSVTSWLDHWLTAFGRSALDPEHDEASIRRLLASGAKALRFQASQVSSLWVNLRLKRRDAVLGDLASGCTPEDIAALRNGLLDDSGYLFPEEVVRDVLAAKRTRQERQVLQDATSSKKRPSPVGGHVASGSGRAPKNQKTSTAVTVAATSSQDQGSSQPFSKAPGKPKGKKKGRAKKRGGAN